MDERIQEYISGKKTLDADYENVWNLKMAYGMQYFMSNIVSFTGLICFFLVKIAGVMLMFYLIG